MANEKKYLEFLDIPDGNGGSERWYSKDAEAQASIAQVASAKANKASGAINNNLAALDGSGNLKDSGYSAADLYDGTLYPVNIDAMTPQSTFRKNALLFINGVGYKAIADTSDFPVTLQVQDGKFVVNIVDGHPAFVVDDDTISEDWIYFTDYGIPHALANLERNFQVALEAGLATKPSLSQVLSAPITSTGGDTYTIFTLLTAIADLMDKKVVTEA